MSEVPVQGSGQGYLLVETGGRLGNSDVVYPKHRCEVTPDTAREIPSRREDAQGTPTQSHISPSILVYEEIIDRV